MDDAGKQILTKLPVEMEPVVEITGGSGEKAEAEDFFTESYSIADLFSSSSS